MSSCSGCGLKPRGEAAHLHGDRIADFGLLAAARAPSRGEHMLMACAIFPSSDLSSYTDDAPEQRVIRLRLAIELGQHSIRDTRTVLPLGNRHACPGPLQHQALSHQFSNADALPTRIALFVYDEHIMRLQVASLLRLRSADHDTLQLLRGW